MQLLKWLWHALRAVLLGLAAVVVLVEEWGWRPLSALLASCAKWAPWERLEARIRSLSRHAALALFLVPAVALFPIKLLALWLIHQDHATLGVVVILAVKLLGTALMGRLFTLTEPQLMGFGWFARALAWWVAVKRRLKLWRIQLWRRRWLRWGPTRRRVVAAVRRLFHARHG